MIKRIIVGGAGGTPSINFIRSLKKAKEKFFIIGVSCDKFDLCKAREMVNRCFLVPPARNKDYFPVIKQIIKETNPDFIHAQNDEEVNVISRYRDDLGVKTFLPRHEVIEICQDKFKSTKCWEEAGIKVPKTILINTEEDLRRAFDSIKGNVWLRATHGAAGKWSFPTNDLCIAKNWIDYYNGWGEISAAEYLSPLSCTWLSIWNKGELVVAQSRKRLYWAFSDRSVSGVTGITGTSVTMSDAEVDEISIAAIKAIDSSPNGIYGVDLTYDKEGIANPTEINIGRFFTTSQFFAEAGLNMPYIYLQLGFGEVPILAPKVNPLEPGLAWVRGMDVEPVLTTIKQIDKFEHDLKKRMAKIKFKNP